MDDLSGLIERVEKAMGPDAILNGDLWWALERPAAERCYWNAAMGMPRPLGAKMPEGLGGMAVALCAPKFTASVDAALALIERALPGWEPGFDHISRGFVVRPADGENFNKVVFGKGATIALSLCLALLRAIQGTAGLSDEVG